MQPSSHKMAKTSTTAHNHLISTVTNFESHNVERLTIVSYNVHGLNQGIVGIHELMATLHPEVIMIQEHHQKTFTNYLISQKSILYSVLPLWMTVSVQDH